MTLKLLAIGDLHLGKRASRLPECLAPRAAELGPTGTFNRAVEAAIGAKVDAVLFGGDVVEHDDDFFEAYRTLHSGVAKLTAAGIRVLGVAGNHDVKVLPRLADHLPTFRLLGRHGAWESETLRASGEAVTLWGWSYPQERVTSSPLAAHSFPRQDWGPSIGLLHCDRDQHASFYAPVTTREIRQSGLDAFCLGHVHKPDALSVENPHGYLGSLVGTDPGEMGAHGAWLLEIKHGKLEKITLWPLANLRWEQLNIDVSAAEGPAEAKSHLLTALQSLNARILSQAFTPAAVGLRLSFSGRCAFTNSLRGLLSDGDKAQVYSASGAPHYFIDQVNVATRPQIALEALAKANNPLGLLARRILILQRSDDDLERQDLLARARDHLGRERTHEAWRSLSPSAPTDSDVAAILENAALTAMDHLIASDEASL